MADVVCEPVALGDIDGVAPTTWAALRLIARNLDCNLAAALEHVVAEFEVPAGVVADG